MNTLLTKLRISRLALGMAVLTTNVSAAPTGLDKADQLQSVLYTGKSSVVKFRVGICSRTLSS